MSVRSRVIQSRVIGDTEHISTETLNTSMRSRVTGDTECIGEIQGDAIQGDRRH